MDTLDVICKWWNDRYEDPILTVANMTCGEEYHYLPKVNMREIIGNNFPLAPESVIDAAISKIGVKNNGWVKRESINVNFF